MPEKPLDQEQIMEMTAGFMPSCLLGAAAELDVFTLLGDASMTANELVEHLGSDPRATRMLLDALTALDVLDKDGDGYRVPAPLRPLLSADSPDTLLPMLQHRMNVVRHWSQLAWVTKAGIPAPRQASIRGPVADRAAFVAAMHSYSGPMADALVARLGPPSFEHLLDVGGASGTWTLAFLRAVTGARATIFDLPDAVEQARHRLAGSELAERVTLAPGDFYTDPLPSGADFAWVSAIVHQHSRQHNRELFAKVHAALSPGGRIAVRDVVLDSSRTRPLFGALFTINMLVNTDTGDTFTFDELAEDLEAAGFADPQLAIHEEDMNSVVIADKL